MPADAKIDGSSEIEKYRLPVCDVDKEKRNFPGYEKKQWYSLAEIQEGQQTNTTKTPSKHKEN